MITENLLKGILLFVYFLVSGFVFSFGKKDTGIGRDYLVFTILIGLILFKL